LRLLSSESGNETLAAEYFQKAATQPSEYTFPFRLEEIDIFNTALTYNKSDGKGAYYLGNLYYYLGQKEKGLDEWEKSVQTGSAVCTGPSKPRFRL
jgi:tetratricopeptide (TPR) repeat protein